MNFPQKRLLMASQNLKERTECGVLDSLVFHADPITAETFPGRELIAQEARMTVRCVEQTLEKLLERGFISLVSEGGGKKKKTVYLVHVERGLPLGQTIHTANPVRPINDSKADLNSEHGSPYEPYSEPHTANATTEMQSYTANATQNGISIRRTPRQPYKEEDKSKRNEELDDEDESESGSQNSSSSPSPELPDLPETSAAICEVSGSNPNRLSPANFRGLKSSLNFLAHLDKNLPDEILADEVRRRFSTEIWPLERPPNPSQIESEWFKQELILKKREHNANPTTDQNDLAAEGRRLRSLAAANPRD